MEATLRFLSNFPVRNLIHGDCRNEIKNGGGHANYWDMMGANTPLCLFSIYAQSLDYSLLICKAKNKHSETQRTQKAIVVSTLGYWGTLFLLSTTKLYYNCRYSYCHGYQTQSKNYVFRWHFPYFFTYFQHWEFAYSLPMYSLVLKGLIEMKNKI